MLTGSSRMTMKMPLWKIGVLGEVLMAMLCNRRTH